MKFVPVFRSCACVLCRPSLDRSAGPVSLDVHEHLKEGVNVAWPSDCLAALESTDRVQ